jgi:uncharacterized protein YhfF
LIATGTKTATCSALWEYEAEGSPLPEPGSKTIVLGGDGDPLCIVETTEVEVRPSIGKEPTADMPLVCERFHVVYR